MKTDGLILTTDRLVLRPLAPTDAYFIARILRNPRVVFWHKKPLSMRLIRGAIRHSLRLNKKGLGWWLAFECKTGALLGDVLLQPLRSTHEVELGYHFLPEYRGRGYATEASKTLLNHGFDSLILPRIRAVVLPYHKASIRIMDKLGFTQRGSHLHAGLKHRYFILQREDYRL